VRVVGKPEVTQLDEKSPMPRLARPALQRLLPPGRQVATDPVNVPVRLSPPEIDRSFGVGKNISVMAAKCQQRA
jgi:hypothetical protein